MTNNLIIGYGEIGSSLDNTLCFHSHIYDPKNLYYKEKPKIEGDLEMMHICFPYSKDFIKHVKQYQKEFKPKYTIIHSTVPVGTSRKCKAIHSPVTGIHPHLGESLKTFTKFLGGDKASEVANYFRRSGISVYVTDKPETTELMKIACTTNYALNIEYTKEIKRQCDKYKVPFEMFTIWNNNYNKGYEELGYPEYHRYNLVPLMIPQQGHCTLPNLKLLKSKFTDFIDKIKNDK